MSAQNGKTLRVVLGDQLSRDLSSLRDIDKGRDVVLMMEVMEEATYVKHHKKKIAFLFSAMRHFASSLEEDGFTVDYIRLYDDRHQGRFTVQLREAVAQHKPERIVVTEPGEYRVLKAMQQWEHQTGVPVDIRKDDRFYCSIDDFKNWAEGRKQLRMEHFYRDMRKRHDILMNAPDEPVGGQWNFDEDNRKPLPDDIDIPLPSGFAPDETTRAVMNLVAERFADHFGDLEPFSFAVTRKQALEVLDKFVAERLCRFGDYQDAMKQGAPFLFHSHLSFYLNCGLLSPREVVARAVAAYEAGDAPLNAVEGFVRQIIGWREFIRGIYWLHMPDYAQKNALGADRPLPDFFWTGETEMNCLRQCITETKENAYAHHIQRLMVLGNFALLAGCDPKEVNEWYLIVYADAYEWVEMPNVTGMILYADGGVFASKPYAASGTYINKMSDYCENCRYSPNKKNGPKACPFNYLYWDFFARNREHFKNNRRVGMMYGTYDRMSDEKKQAIADDTRRFLKEIGSGKEGTS